MLTQKEQITEMIAKLETVNAIPHDKIATWETGYPQYHPQVRDLFIQMDSFWIDFDYVQHVENLSFDEIDTYDLDQLKSILTKLSRTERFHDGSWEQTVKSGILVNIQVRLEAILNEA